METPPISIKTCLSFLLPCPLHLIFQATPQSIPDGRFNLQFFCINAPCPSSKPPHIFRITCPHQFEHNNPHVFNIYISNYDDLHHHLNTQCNISLCSCMSAVNALGVAITSSEPHTEGGIGAP